MRFVLASASPRRKELLKELIQDFEIIPAVGEENCHGLSPRKLVKALATQKATEVANRLECKGKIVLGSDTVVALGNAVLGKPKDEEDAKRMLRSLSGRAHYVYTGICFVYPTASGRKTIAKVGKTKVYFNSLSEEQISDYVASGSPMDKAGAYGIQDGELVKKIRGSFSCVVGLPVELCKKTLKKVLKEVGND